MMVNKHSLVQRFWAWPLDWLCEHTLEQSASSRLCNTSAVTFVAHSPAEIAHNLSGVVNTNQRHMLVRWRQVRLPQGRSATALLWICHCVTWWYTMFVFIGDTIFMAFIASDCNQLENAFETHKSTSLQYTHWKRNSMMLKTAPTKYEWRRMSG